MINLCKEEVMGNTYCYIALDEVTYPVCKACHCAMSIIQKAK